MVGAVLAAASSSPSVNALRPPWVGRDLGVVRYLVGKGNLRVSLLPFKELLSGGPDES